MQRRSRFLSQGRCQAEHLLQMLQLSFDKNRNKKVVSDVFTTDVKF